MAFPLVLISRRQSRPFGRGAIFWRHFRDADSNARFSSSPRSLSCGRGAGWLALCAACSWPWSRFDSCWRRRIVFGFCGVSRSHSAGRLGAIFVIRSSVDLVPLKLHSVLLFDVLDRFKDILAPGGSRTEYIRAGMRMFREHPLLGVGPDALSHRVRARPKPRILAWRMAGHRDPNPQRACQHCGNARTARAFRGRVDHRRHGGLLRALPRRGQLP